MHVTVDNWFWVSWGSLPQAEGRLDTPLLDGVRFPDSPWKNEWLCRILHSVGLWQTFWTQLVQTFLVHIRTTARILIRQTMTRTLALISDLYPAMLPSSPALCLVWGLSWSLLHSCCWKTCELAPRRLSPFWPLQTSSVQQATSLVPSTFCFMLIKITTRAVTFFNISAGYKHPSPHGRPSVPSVGHWSLHSTFTWWWCTTEKPLLPGYYPCTTS